MTAPQVPSLIDTIEQHTAAHWSQVHRVAHALHKIASTLQSDAEKFAAAGSPRDLIDGAGCEAASMILHEMAHQIEREARS